MLVVLRYGPCRVVAPDRIVTVINESRCFAFAYGTLPGHPARGEESFAVERRADDTVRATIRVQATPATFLARVGTPIVKRFQAAALQKYLFAIAAHVEGERMPDPADGDEQ